MYGGSVQVYRRLDDALPSSTFVQEHCSAALTHIPTSCLLSPGTWPLPNTTDRLTQGSLNAGASADAAVAESIVGRVLSMVLPVQRQSMANLPIEAGGSQAWAAVALPTSFGAQVSSQMAIGHYICIHMSP